LFWIWSETGAHTDKIGLASKAEKQPSNLENWRTNRLAGRIVTCSPFPIGGPTRSDPLFTGQYRVGLKRVTSARFAILPHWTSHTPAQTSLFFPNYSLPCSFVPQFHYGRILVAIRLRNRKTPCSTNSSQQGLHRQIPQSKAFQLFGYLYQLYICLWFLAFTDEFSVHWTRL